MDRILLAVDGSEGSWRAARLAGQLSRAFDADVDVLNVVERLQSGPHEVAEEYERIEHVYITHEQLLRAAGGKVVDRASSLVREAGGAVGKQEVVAGRPAREIVDYAEDVDASMIVMGRRGLSGARGLLLGSVSTKVGHLSGRTLVTTE